MTTPLEPTAGVPQGDEAAAHLGHRDQERETLRGFEICRRHGISDETLRRWRRNPAVGFPLPLPIPGAPRWSRIAVARFFDGQTAGLANGRRRFFRTAVARRHAPRMG